MQKIIDGIRDFINSSNPLSATGALLRMRETRATTLEMSEALRKAHDLLSQAMRSGNRNTANDAIATLKAAQDTPAPAPEKKKKKKNAKKAKRGSTAKKSRG